MKYEDLINGETNFLNESVSWDGNIVKAMLPKFDVKKDSIYLSKEIVGKSDNFYRKLIPHIKYNYETKKGENYTLLKQSGKNIHSDDFSKQIDKAKKTKSKIYYIIPMHAEINGNNVLPYKITGFFDGVTGKWVESIPNQNNIIK